MDRIYAMTLRRIFNSSGTVLVFYMLCVFSEYWRKAVFLDREGKIALSVLLDIYALTKNEAVGAVKKIFSHSVFSEKICFSSTFSAAFPPFL